MADNVICIDTSILIDYYRKKSKEQTAFFRLTTAYDLFVVSIVTHYEILIGADAAQELFWSSFFERMTILPFDKAANKVAVTITKQLKLTNKLIDIPDIFIAATAIANNTPIATLNKKHFERIPGLDIIYT